MTIHLQAVLTSRGALALGATLLAGGVLSSCKSNGGGPGHHGCNPPIVVDKTDDGSWQMGRSATIKFAAEGGTEPITWVDIQKPETWSTESSSRDLTATGTMGVGSASPGITIVAAARGGDDSTSTPFSRSINARTKTFDASVEFCQDRGAFKQYRIKMPELPEWPANSQGHLFVWVDTEGLAPAGPQDDVVKLFNDDTPPNPTLTGMIDSDGLTKPDFREGGESFTLRGEDWRMALQDKQIGCSLRCYHGNKFRIVKVRVTVY